MPIFGVLLSNLKAQDSLVTWEFISKDRSVHIGQFEEANLTLHSRIGAVIIPVNDINELSFRSHSQDYDRVRTQHRNLISGLVNEPLRIQSVTGESIQFLPSSLDRILRRQIEPDPMPEFNSQYVILRNGDMISGRLATKAVRFKSAGQSELKEIASIESIRLQAFPDTVSVLYRDGHQVSGTIEINAIDIHLDSGTRLAISPWEIATVFCRKGFTPVSVIRFFDERKEGQPPQDSPVAPFENFVWIPAGQFVMGSESSEPGRGSDEGPQTEMTITKGFWMSQFEVTQAEYLEEIGSNPSTFTKDPQNPVEKVNWHEAVAYCRQRTVRAREAGTLPRGDVFRLPTEAEWEYACRAGTSSRFSYGDDPSDSELGTSAWYVENSNSSPHPVGQLEPNPWGLYDMHGNVWEWCYDQWQYAYPGGKAKDFLAREDGWLRVARGGSWLYSASNCRSANRDDYGPNNRCSDIGFRLVLARPLKQ